MNATILVSVLIGVGIALVFIRLGSIERRLNRLARVEAKVDALLKHAGIAFDPYQGVPAEVREAIERGEIIHAVRLVREATGVDLKEAKEFVDEVRRRKPRS